MSTRLRVPKRHASNAQCLVDHMEHWSCTNRFQLNLDKCKEQRMYFAIKKPESHCPPPPPPPPFDEWRTRTWGRGVCYLSPSFGVMITSDLSWNMHERARGWKKTSKRLYFLLQLKQTNIPIKGLITFYTSCIRSVCGYAVLVFHSSLPMYLINVLESVQKRSIYHLPQF